MSSANFRKSFLLVLGGILILALMAVAAIKSGKLPDFLEPYGFIFVLVGGIALVMISFPGNEIRRALMHAMGAPGNNAELRTSILFWEATGRSFWMLGGLRSVLSILLAFDSMKSEETAGVQAIMIGMVKSLLGSFYGILLAVICLIPCWKLLGKLQNRPLLPDSEQGESLLTGIFRLRYSAVAGYVLFFIALILTIPNQSRSVLWNMSSVTILNWPSLLVVLGGALALLLFIGEVNSGPPLSMSFACMGFIGFLMAFIQTLLGFASSKIGSLASAIVFLLSSCFAALLGMILIGAPLEDRAVRTGRIAAPSAFSRVSWYGFPVLTLILVPLVVVLITTPVPRSGPQVTEVSAPIQEQRARYEARSPQSEPVNFPGANQFLIYRVNPAYPEQAKREGIQGTVKLTIIINEEGFVYEVKGNPENNPLLERAAIPAVKRWRYRPFLMKGVPVAMETTATVNFALK
jgi:TonB family protein